MGRGKRKSNNADNDDAIDDDNDLNESQVSRGGRHSAVGIFSSQIPECSQSILPVRESERTNLLAMTEESREKVLLDLSRLILFKALAGEPIDRLKCCKEAGISSEKISSPAFEEVKTRLENVFGFELRRYPKWMERMKKIPSKFKDRYYVVNANHIDGDGDDNADGQHSKIIHSTHGDCAIQKALLMIVLAFAYCKGDPRPDGSRWISDHDLYRLLNAVDENIPSKPPSATSHVRGASNSKKRSSGGGDDFRDGAGGVSLTPNVDEALNQFVHLDYLLKDKITDEIKEHSQTITQTQLEEGGFVYSMGPRAAIEIGRKQIIYFCAEILDEKEPDKTMLMELEADLQDEEDAEQMDMEVPVQ